MVHPFLHGTADGTGDPDRCFVPLTTDPCEEQYDAADSDRNTNNQRIPLAPPPPQTPGMQTRPAGTGIDDPLADLDWSVDVRRVFDGLWPLRRAGLRWEDWPAAPPEAARRLVTVTRGGGAAADDRLRRAAERGDGHLTVTEALQGVLGVPHSGRLNFLTACLLGTVVPHRPRTFGRVRRCGRRPREYPVDRLRTIRAVAALLIAAPADAVADIQAAVA